MRQKEKSYAPETVRNDYGSRNGYRRFARVLSKLEDVLGFPVEIKIKGKPVEEQAVWADLVARHTSADALEVHADREDPNKIHKEVRRSWREIFG